MCSPHPLTATSNAEALASALLVAHWTGNEMAALPDHQRQEDAVWLAVRAFAPLHWFIATNRLAQELGAALVGEGGRVNQKTLKRDGLLRLNVGTGCAHAPLKLADRLGRLDQTGQDEGVVVAFERARRLVTLVAGDVHEEACQTEDGQPYGVIPIACARPVN